MSKSVDLLTVQQANQFVGRCVLKGSTNYTVQGACTDTGEIRVWDPTTQTLLIFVSAETFNNWAYGEPVACGVDYGEISSSVEREGDAT